ncbi:MAG TPA: hypothetical protein VFG09_07080 [Thermodesulfovibrionales bacterium]|jgi:hypothetical protein|nr:hypothetical protein [Thermodesulfovibrionales bacterium]
MRTTAARTAVVLLFSLLLTSSCTKARPISSWERHCQGCHDGKTVLNGKVVIGKEEMKERYKTLSQFLNACEGSASCMNILKHQEKLLREVGEELGIKDH